MESELYQRRKQTVYDLMCDPQYVPMKIRQLSLVLGVQKEDRQELEQILAELLAEGKIALSKQGLYSNIQNWRRTGVFDANPKGFGFVKVDGEERDIFIPESRTNGAMHTDTVEIEIFPETGGRRREGTVLRIVERGTRVLVGTYEENNSYGFVVPDNVKYSRHIFVQRDRAKNAADGDKVVVSLISYGGKEKKPEGRVEEILGHRDEPGVDILSLIRAYDLPTEFAEKALHQVERAAHPVTEEEREGRRDLKDWQMVTIDGEDAKDLDDAVSLVMEGESYRLGVHIADVSHYVQEHSALDKDALKRGNSVYLVDRVIPMLPPALSNGICSLNQGEDRLALSCIMTINPKGEVIDHEIAETVISVDRRMTYTNVKKILTDHDGELRAEYAELVPMLERMERLAAILRKKRMKRGSIDFDFPETKVILDEQGKPVEIRPYDRNVATKMIEEFMLIANETVASDYFWQEIPFVYRTHERPDSDKIRSLSAFINNFGYSIRIGAQEVHPKELQKLLEKIEGSEEEALISRLTLRSMKQARYTVENTGHFGLAAGCYCHFTSPIRRYPDLQIHRIIKENLHGWLKRKRIAHYEEILPEVCSHTSRTERRADEAERETVKLKKAEYMSAHIGECFDGVISGVTDFGLYVELPNTVEGLVRMSELKDDYYRFYESTYELVGEATNRRYKLGQKLRIRVDGASCVTRTIDFSLAGDT